MSNNKVTIYEQTKAALKAPATLERFTEILGSLNSARPYLNSVAIAVANSDQLQECAPGSILHAAAQAATLRLSCDPTLGHAYLVPFNTRDGKKASFVIGYKGYQQMALRTGKYRIINVATVWEGQTVNEDQLRGMHSIDGYKANGEAKAIGYMLYFELLTGFSKTYYMTVEEIHQHAKRYSKSYSYKTSAWQTNFEDMARKTVVRLGLTHYGYFDESDFAVMGAMEFSESENEDDYVDAEWIEQAERENEKMRAKSEPQLMEALGFDIEPEPDKTEPEPEAEYPSWVASVETSDGEPYTTLDNDRLREIVDGTAAKLPEATGARKAELKKRHDAAEKILQYRKSQQAQQTALV